MKTILVDAKGALIIKGKGINQPLFDLLEKYPNPKIVVTDANDEESKALGLDAVTYPVFTMKHNPDKPNPDYFKTLMQKFHLSIEEIVYFDHKIEAVESARSLGIVAYYYDSEKGFLGELGKFLDTNI